MKTEIVKTEQNNQDIDWGRPMLVKSIHSDVFIITDGLHKGNMFSGTILLHEDDSDCIGIFLESFAKSEHTPITEPITIKFIP